MPPILTDFSNAYPNVDVEILTGTRRFSLAQREADIAFRTVPFDTADVIQRRLFTLDYGVYIAQEAADPECGDGTGCRLITPSARHFPDIAWLLESFPHARPVLRSNNCIVQGRMCRQGVGIAVLPCVVGNQIPGTRRLELPTSPPGRDVWMGYHRDLRRLERFRAFISTISNHLTDATA
ncbi:LysR substrate-binding domain-containing protein [Dankookia sp. P2]|uniref:LysR substrate-binding domain-containing protein n=1 Tax=Dankookia sp. P2 TaxID=3423955 RepID=UPI003D66BF77